MSDTTEASFLQSGDKILVSLTTTSERIGTVHEVIKTMLNQTVKPDEIHLFISRDAYLRDSGIKRLTPQLQNLVDSNLITVSITPNTGSYRKLLPLLRQRWESNASIITIDDDTLYPPNTIYNLVRGFEEVGCVIATSGCKVSKRSDGAVRPWHKWPRRLQSQDTDFLNFPIGKDGVLYRWEFFDERVFDPIAIRIAPYADDVWFRCHSWVNNVKCRIIGTNGGFLPQIKGYRRRALWNINRFENDRQISEVAKHLELAFLLP